MNKIKCNTVKPGLYVSAVVAMHFDQEFLTVPTLTFLHANLILQATFFSVTVFRNYGTCISELTTTVCNACR
jgi:hypothetical protein